MDDRNLYSDEAATMYVRQRVMMTPEKFGYVGSFSRELLEAAWDRTGAQALMLDQVLLRLTTSVLCGRAVSEHPEVTLNLPKTWWQHLKWNLQTWRDKQDARWKSEPPPWMVLLWPFLVLYPRFLVRHPVKWRKITAQVNFEQRVLYPEMDHIPAAAGRPVIYETLDLNWSATTPWGSGFSTGPDRFLNRHEIIRELYTGPDVYGYIGRGGAEQVLTWLERHGVNPDQLVKRDACPL